MLETYNYERTLLQTTNRIVANDLYRTASSNRTKPPSPPWRGFTP